jgi:hypothetical protein
VDWQQACPHLVNALQLQLHATAVVQQSMVLLQLSRWLSDTHEHAVALQSASSHLLNVLQLGLQAQADACLRSST